MTIPRSRRARAVVALLGLVIASGGCGRYARSGAAPEASASKPPVTYGSGIKVQDPISTVGTPKAKGGLEVRVLDENTGAPLAGVYVTYKGPQRGRMRSDADGVARAQVKAGRYEVKVAACGDTILIDEEIKGTAQVVGGGKAQRGQLLVRYFTARYLPSNSAEASVEAPWARNRRVVLGVKVDDGCDITRIVKDVSVRHLAWRTAGRVALIDTPERTDAQGFARVTVACTGAGDPDVFIYLPGADPPVEVNVITSMSRPFSGSWCA